MNNPDIERLSPRPFAKNLNGRIAQRRFGWFDLSGVLVVFGLQIYAALFLCSFPDLRHSFVFLSKRNSKISTTGFCYLVPTLGLRLSFGIALSEHPEFAPYLQIMRLWFDDSIDVFTNVVIPGALSLALFAVFAWLAKKCPPNSRNSTTFIVHKHFWLHLYYPDVADRLPEFDSFIADSWKRLAIARQA